MIHGSRERFAIEWELDADPGGKWLFGRCCFWVGSLQVGDYDAGTTLSDVFVNLAYPVGDCGKRQSARFCGMESLDAFDCLHNGLFESDPSVADLVIDEMWGRFDVSIPVDVFDGWRLYLVDCEAESRLLVGRWSETSHRYEFTVEQKLRPGEFDGIVQAFQKVLEAAFETHAR